MINKRLLELGRESSTTGWIILLWLASAVAVQAAEPMIRFLAQRGGKVSIKGSCDLHDFDIQGKEIEGQAEFGPGFLAANSRALALGKIPGRIEGSIPVGSLHYGAGTAMDKALRHYLKEELNPRITFRFNELSLKTSPQASDAPYVLDARGELVVAGVTNQISMPMQVRVIDRNKLKLAGTTSATMTDFGISPPVFHGNHPIKYRDEVKLSVEWLVAREPDHSRKEKP